MGNVQGTDRNIRSFKRWISTGITLALRCLEIIAIFLRQDFLKDPVCTTTTQYTINWALLLNFTKACDVLFVCFERQGLRETQRETGRVDARPWSSVLVSVWPHPLCWGHERPGAEAEHNRWPEIRISGESMRGERKPVMRLRQTSNIFWFKTVLV